MKPTPRCAAACNGFTLPELLLALLVAAIVAGAAVSNLQPALRHARRSAAVAALLELELHQQRHRALHGRYADSLDALGWRGGAPTGYRLGLRGGPAQEDGFMLQAEPVGAQAQDRCGVLRVDQLGRRDADAPGCW